MTRLTHFAGGYRGLGGVEAILKEHWRVDKQYGIDSRFVILYEPPEPPVDRVSFLDITPKSSIRDVRRSLGNAIGERKSDVAVYHNMWGVHQYGDLDQAERRMFVIHGWAPFLQDLLLKQHPFSDGFLCVSRPLEKWVRTLLSDTEPERIGYIPIPIFPPARGTSQSPLIARPLVIGFCGRIIIEQKRVDRTAAFVAALDSAGLDYRLEFLGDGPEMPMLTKLAAGNSRIILHGRQSGENYWAILKSWDVLISFSDYEGTPLSMLEAMSQGVLPVMPRMNSGADEYAEMVDPSFVYAPQDFTAVAQVLRQLSQMQSNRITALREKTVGLIAEHSTAGYMETFVQSTARIRALPRRSRREAAFRPFPINAVSFRSLDRLAKFRKWISRGYSGLRTQTPIQM